MAGLANFVMIVGFSLLACVPISNTFPTTVAEHNPEEAGYFQGDIRFPEVSTRNGIIGQNYRWVGGVVPIEMDTEFSAYEKAVVNAGLADISSQTCIRFVNRTTQPNYVFIDRGDLNSGCWSYIGNVNRGRQVLNLQPPSGPGGSCIYQGIVAHEMMHALGFYHEQSRTDRDSYVTINYENIQDGKAYEFNKYTAAQVYDQGVSYDYGSIMHYEYNAYAKNWRLPTITAPAGVAIGQRNGLSAKDVQKIKNMYSCTATGIGRN